MVKILLDLDEDEDKFVEVFKIMNSLNSKQDAIKKMIQFFKVEVKPLNVNEKQYFKD